jgi:NAD(P)-dependent dehydrogenase (short-subunit alcohol dehydrogenase family)
MNRHLTILTGASRGMGLALAKQLLQPDAAVLCISRHTNPSLSTAAAQCAATLEQWTHDLAQAEPIAARLLEWLQGQKPEQLASVTLINNAGVIPTLSPMRNSDPAELARALRVGLEAPLRLCSAFLNATQTWTIPRKILNVSSGLGRRAMASQSAYCAAKAGMDHFTRCMALDEATQPNGARVCSLAPGVIDTDMQLQLRNADRSKFPDQESFSNLHLRGQLTSPEHAASQLLAYLERPDFGHPVIADVRDTPTLTGR